MPQPQSYTPTTDFSQQEAANASGRSSVNTAALDAELANIEATLDQTLENLTLLQRDDGRLKDLLCELHTLSPEVLNLIGGFNLRGLWLQETAYSVNDIATNAEYTYWCKTAHTSGTEFEPQYWIQFGFSSGTDAAQAAAAAQVSANEADASADAAVAAAGSASGFATTATTQAASASASASTATTQASAAATSATNASNSATTAQTAAANLPNATTAGADTFIQSNPAGTGWLYKTAAQVLSALGLIADAGSSLIGFIQAGVGAIARTVQDKLRDHVSVKDFGLKTSNTAAQNKAAFVAAIASLTRPSILKVPQGFYNIAPDIDLGAFVVGFDGDGKYQTSLSVSPPVVGTYVFGLPDATTTEYISIKNLGLFGGGLVANAVRVAKCNHSLIENALATGFSVSALHLGGYSNDIVGSDIFLNTGSGLTLVGTLNNVNVVRSRIYANDGIGIDIASTDTDAGLSINITQGSAIEGNKVAGIMSANTKALNIKDSYVERNGSLGYTYTVPETINVKADIHLLASLTKTLEAVPAYANKSVSICGNHATAIGVGTALPNQDGFVFTTYADNLLVENNQMFDATKINALVAMYQNSDRSMVAGSLRIVGNTKNTINYIGSLDANIQRPETAHLISIPSQPITKNYADNNFLSWLAYSGTTGGFVRSSNKWQGGPIFQIADGDFTFGKTIDLTANQELRGNWVYFGMWMNTQGSSTFARLTLSGQGSSGVSEVVGTDGWTFVSVCRYVDPAETGMNALVQKIGTGSALLVGHPVIAIVGNEYQKYPFIPVTWYRAGGVVGNGTWEVGDRIYNSTPVVGQPKSWVCTVAGTPGTWVSEGNL